MVELLSPAGNMEKLKSAVLYGADAVYLAGQVFGMRAAADNFTVEELCEAVRFAHGNGVKVYLTVNTMPREHEYPILRKYFEEIKHIPLDAMIVADVGVMRVLREILPDMEIHVSTQANTVSSSACLMWRELGAKRVVLAREISFDEIKEIRKKVPDDLELEAFIHGSMCISYSGRCLLSNHFTGRDGNRGACAQPCRWNYKIREGGYEIVEEKRPEASLPVYEIDGETFIMSSRDTCMIEHIPELMESGINSFKIEGRIKSAYYTAVVTNAYRMAIDSYLSGNYKYDPNWLRELMSVSHRDYATGYYFSDCHTDANTVESVGYIREKAYLATVLSYNKETGMAFCIQRNKFSLGDSVEMITPGMIGRKFVAEGLRGENKEIIESVPHPSMKFYMKVPFAVREGDILRSAD